MAETITMTPINMMLVRTYDEERASSKKNQIGR
jgi:hypothetical protein